MRSVLASAALACTFAFIALASCDSGSGSQPDAGPPPKICRTPAAVSPIHFTEVTDDWGVGAGATFDPLAVSVIAADFDGDGFPDLVITTGWSQAGNYVGTATDPHDGMRVRHLLMNRASASDPTQRTFVDMTDASGILASPSGAGERGFGLANAGDLDDDGDVDLVTCPQDTKSDPAPDGSSMGDDVTDGCAALLNDGTGHFTLASPSDLGAHVFWVPSAALFDYDRDGYLDFWPATVAHWPYPVTPPVPNTAPVLFRGNGDGTFTNVAKQVGLPYVDGKDFNGTSFRHVFGVTACDIDGDGDDDMIFADYGRQENEVWRNDNGTFTNVAHTLGVDYDDNQNYSDDQTYLCYCQNNPGTCPANTPAPIPGFCCAFCTNDTCTAQCGPYGRGWIPGTSDQAWNLGGNKFSIACGDVDDDGDMDLMTATIVHGDVGQSSDPSELLLNPGDGTKMVRPGNDKTGLLRDTSKLGISWNHGDNQAVFADLDLDGRKDIVITDTAAYDVNGVVERSHVYVFHQKSDGTFEDVTTASGILGAKLLPHLESPTFVDLDGDGDLDLVAGDMNTQRLHVYRNDSAQEQNWTRIRLVGAGAGAANTSGIGAIVRVTAGGRTQTQYVSGGFGHGNVQADLSLTFGLGPACSIDSISVRWPDAASSTSTFTNVQPNYPITIRQGATSVDYP